MESWLAPAPIILDLSESRADPIEWMGFLLGCWEDDIELMVLSIYLLMFFLYFLVSLFFSLFTHLLPRFLSELLDKTLGRVGLMKRSLKVPEFLSLLEVLLELDFL